MNLIWIWKMTLFLMMKSFQTLMMEIIFWQMKVLKELDFGTFTSCSCTVVSSQVQQSLTELDPSADFLSSKVPDPSDKWEDDDIGFCVFDEISQ